MLIAGLILVACLAAVGVVAAVERALRRRRARRYAELLDECLARQPDHEREHIEAHGGHFTSALRTGNVANRFERKIHAAGLPPLSRDERHRRAKEALWPPK